MITVSALGTNKDKIKFTPAVNDTELGKTPEAAGLPQIKNPANWAEQNWGQYLDQCPENADKIDGECVCRDGFAIDENGQCVVSEKPLGGLFSGWTVLIIILVLGVVGLIFIGGLVITIVLVSKNKKKKATK